MRSDRNVVVPIDAIIGTFRTFGQLGPVYEIIGVCEPATGTTVNLQIRVVESGEQLDYPLSHALDDPLAR
ncbi:MAG: DUF5397 family protein [Hyphomicrobium sp.]